MILLRIANWQLTAGVICLATVAGTAVWLFMRPRPSADELERARRKSLAQAGRLVDGMLLDVCEMEIADGRSRTMLIFSYRIGGVDYECSQDITALQIELDPAEIRAGFPCSVRYQPGRPLNSIVIAEEWSGLRFSLPEFPGPATRERRLPGRS